MRWKLRVDGPSQPSPPPLTEPPRFLPVQVVAGISPVVAEPIEIALPNGPGGSRSAGLRPPWATPEPPSAPEHAEATKNRYCFRRRLAIARLFWRDF
ncbi:hypothetical protein [Sorangium sp. So ce1389]|uniref:hypothetical protein n=1 Tax=Sorangium sp. So ce1389 TaxID=3133336 RepID=UPI003F5D70D4